MLNRLYDELETSGKRAGKCRTAGITCRKHYCGPDKHEGLSPKTVANIHGVLHKALGDAVKWGKLARNVADAVESPRADRGRTEVWTVEQLRTFLNHVAQDRLYAMWLLFATSGMRRGEVAGLAWPDLDLDAGLVRIDWTLGLVDAKPTSKLRPKSRAGKRTMALDPATVDALRAWRKQQLSAGAWASRSTPTPTSCQPLTKSRPTRSPRSSMAANTWASRSVWPRLTSSPPDCASDAIGPSELLSSWLITRITFFQVRTAGGAASPSPRSTRDR